VGAAWRSPWSWWWWQQSLIGGKRGGY